MTANKHLFVVALMLLALGIAPPATTIVIPGVHRAYASTRSMTLVGNLGGWNTTVPGPTITALQGDAVNIQLSQPDVTHRFYVDVNGNQIPDCPSPDKCGPPYSSLTSYSFNVDFGPGTYTYYCSIHPSMRGTFNVQGLNVTPSPSSLTLTRGSSQVSTITVTSVGGFSGTVDLSLPSTPSGISTQFLTSTTVTVGPSAPGTASLNVTAAPTVPAGSYTVPITSSNGTISKTTNLAVSVVSPDFAVTSSPTSLSVFVGSSGSATITLTSQNGFTGSLSLMVSASPSTISLSLSPLTVSLSSGGSATSTLNISTTFGPTTSSPGTYNVTVTAMATGNPSTSHTTTLSVEVKSPTSGKTPTSVLITAGITIVAAGGIAGYAILRRRRGRKQGSLKPR